VSELKRLVKGLQSATTQEILGTLGQLKAVVASESLLRESKAGLAVGKLRSHSAKEVADAAKELVKKWKTEVDRDKHKNGTSGAKAGDANGGTNKAAPARKSSVAESSGTPPVTPTVSSPTLAFKNGQARTAKADGVKCTVTGDSTRDRCIELIYDALAADSGAPNEQIIKRATGIESAVLSDFGSTNKDYKTKMRSLYLNLKDKNNPGLRDAIIGGELDVKKFAKMSSQDMASEERKAADRKIQEENLHKSLGAHDPQAETDAFQCGRCKQRKTRYRQAQTRSADEPMTTFVTCVNCNHRWKFS